MQEQVTRGTTTRDPGVLAWMRLARVYTAIDRRTAQFLRQFELTTAQFDVIAQVGAREGLTQQELAQALLVTKGNVTQLLDRLEERGLIERRTAPGRRGKAIHLTETGRALNRQAVPAQEAMIATLFEPLEREDRIRLGGLLRRIDRTLGEPGEGV
jgi:DNA-binding MarR family transcriptional regulator